MEEFLKEDTVMNQFPDLDACNPRVFVSSAPVTTGMAQPVAPVKSMWTEHTSPEGFL